MNESLTIDTITNLGGTGAIVALFLWYLKSRDELMQEIVNNITEAIRGMSSEVKNLADAIKGLDKRIHNIEQEQRRGRSRPK